MILKGEKTILRPIKMADAPRFVKWLSDDEVNKFTTRKFTTYKKELEETKKWIKNFSKYKNDLQFAIDTKEKIHIGSIALKNIDKRDSNATMDILIGDKNYWNRGYGSDAMKVLLNFGFKKLNLHKINLDGGGVYEYNLRAIKAYKRLGFKKEGVNRESVLYKGKFYDCIPMGILRSEWLKKNVKK